MEGDTARPVTGERSGAFMGMGRGKVNQGRLHFGTDAD